MRAIVCAVLVGFLIVLASASPSGGGTESRSLQSLPGGGDLSTLPSGAGMESASPFPMARGTDIVIRGTGLAGTDAVTFDGIDAPIVAPPTDDTLVVRVPDSLPLPPPTEFAAVEVCREFAGMVECRSGAVAGDVFLADPPVLIGQVEMQASRVRVDGGIAYVRADDALKTIDVSDPTAPQVLATLPIGNNSGGIRLLDGKAYLAARDLGLIVVDVSDPAAPSITGSVPLVNALGIDVEPGVAYLSTGTFFVDRKITVVDVVDPFLPTVLTTIDPLDFDFLWEVPVDLDGDYLYVSTVSGEGGGRLYVLDVSDPAAPFVVSPGAVLSGSNGLEAVGGYAYAGDSTDGSSVADFDLGEIDHSSADFLRIIDVSDPGAPVEASTVRTAWNGSSADGLDVVGDLAFVTHNRRMTVVDVSDRTDPVFLSLVEIQHPRQPEVSGCEAYVPGGPEGLLIYDVSGFFQTDDCSPSGDDDEDEDDDEGSDEDEDHDWPGANEGVGVDEVFPGIRELGVRGRDVDEATQKPTGSSRDVPATDRRRNRER